MRIWQIYHLFHIYLQIYHLVLNLANLLSFNTYNQLNFKNTISPISFLFLLLSSFSPSRSSYSLSLSRHFHVILQNPGCNFHELFTNLMVILQIKTKETEIISQKTDVVVLKKAEESADNQDRSFISGGNCSTSRRKGWARWRREWRRRGCWCWAI